jgi:hypothetical protein
LASLSPGFAGLLYSCWRRYLWKDSMGGFPRVLIFKGIRGELNLVIRNSLLL